jgi:2-oxoglutarate ferredoxin oxidoreductase subunit gamma
VIADEEIGSPFVQFPQVVLALNLPSLDKYEAVIKPGGLIVVNTSIIPREITRTDIRVSRVPANEIAEKLGDKRVTNMVMLGAMLANQPVLRLDALEQAYAKHMPNRLQKSIQVNVQALKEGAQYLAEGMKA